MGMWAILRKPRYFVLAATVTVILSVVYYYLDIRSAGDDPKTATPRAAVTGNAQPGHVKVVAASAREPTAVAPPSLRLR